MMLYNICWWRGCLMVSARLERSRFEPWPGSLCFTISVCLYPGEKKIGADKCNAMGNIGMVLHPIPGLEGVEMLPVA